MPIYLGANKIGEIYLGSNEISDAYLGSTQVYQNAPSYVAGMDIWLDAINNTGSGHNNNASTWADLSGNGYNATISLSGGDRWTANSLAIQNDNTCVRINATKFTGNYTMEFCVRLTANYNYGTLMRLVTNYTNRGAWIDSGGDTIFRVASSYDTANTNLSISALNTITMVNSGNTQKTYINGVLKATYTRTPTGTTDTAFDVFASSARSNRHIKGEAYSFRYYASVLTDDEIRQNRQVDLARFL